MYEMNYQWALEYFYTLHFKQDQEQEEKSLNSCVKKSYVQNKNKLVIFFRQHIGMFDWSDTQTYLDQLKNIWEVLKG